MARTQTVHEAETRLLNAIALVAEAARVCSMRLPSSRKPREFAQCDCPRRGSRESSNQTDLIPCGMKLARVVIRARTVIIYSKSASDNRLTVARA
jgi:hypothetical protein